MSQIEPRIISMLSFLSPYENLICMFISRQSSDFSSPLTSVLDAWIINTNLWWLDPTKELLFTLQHASDANCQVFSFFENCVFLIIKQSFISLIPQYTYVGTCYITLHVSIVLLGNFIDLQSLRDWVLLLRADAFHGLSNAWVMLIKYTLSESWLSKQLNKAFSSR